MLLVIFPMFAFPKKLPPRHKKKKKKHGADSTSNDDDVLKEKSNSKGQTVASSMGFGKDIKGVYLIKVMWWCTLQEPCMYILACYLEDMVIFLLNTFWEIIRLAEISVSVIILKTFGYCKTASLQIGPFKGWLCDIKQTLLSKHLTIQLL